MRIPLSFIALLMFISACTEPKMKLRAPEPSAAEKLDTLKADSNITSVKTSPEAL